MERLIKYFTPEKYILDLAIDKYAKTISGVVNVAGEAKDETVKFHAVNLKITDVLVNGRKSKYDADGKILTVSGVAPGKAEITIYYDGKLNENMQGAYLSTYEYDGKTEVIVATQFESHYAREAFPCIDEPEAKAVFELSITTDADDMVLANTPKLKSYPAPRPSGPFVFGNSRPKGRAPRADGAISRAAALRNTPDSFLTSAFSETPRMSTYLLAFVIGKFHGKTITNEHGVKITTYCALNQELGLVDFANEIAAKSLEFYDDNFGVSYPLEKLDQVALPDFEAGAMENWGLVTYRESMLLAGKNSTVGTKKSVALTVAHELSHQWFGDLVTMAWWDDLWLNESFASVMEYYAVDAVHPEYKIFEGFFTGDSLAALKRDEYKDVQSVHQDVKSPEEIATLFDSAIVYAKGARLMLMLIRLIGWEKFTAGISDYFEKFAYKNTVGDDLWKALDKYAEFDVQNFMHTFIDRPGYPVITSINSDGDFGKITQKRFLLDGEMTESSWPLPKITEDMSGHYILNLSEKEFDVRLAQFDKLGLEEKLRLLIDKSLTTKTNLASSASLIPLIKKFEDEDSAAVWSIILSIIGGLKIFFEYKSKEEEEFKKFVGDLVKKKLGEIGISTRDNDDENILRLRSILLALDYYAKTRENLESLAALYDENFSKMDTEIREDILAAKIYLEPEMFDNYLEKYKVENDPEIKFDLLTSLCLVKDEENIEKVIGLLSRLDVVKPQDQFYLFIYLYRNPAISEKAFSWLTKNWEDVVKMAGDKSIDNYPRYIANTVRSEDESKKYDEFFSPMKDNPALKRAILVGQNEIRSRLELIKKDQAEVFKLMV